MKSTRNRSAWVLLAVAVMVASTLVRAEPGGARAAAYAHPVFEFLTGHTNASSLTSRQVPELIKNWSARHASMRTQAGNAGVWQAMLPVLFIGLVAPLSLISSRSIASLCRVPSAPALPSSFQRPPPVQLV